MTAKKTDAFNDLVLELDFVPKWARKAPGENPYKSVTGDDPKSARHFKKGGKYRDKKQGKKRTAERPTLQKSAPNKNTG